MYSLSLSTETLSHFAAMVTLIQNDKTQKNLRREKIVSALSLAPQI